MKEFEQNEMSSENGKLFSVCTEAVKRCEESPYFRIVLFGASNTERYLPSVHWGDVLETGLRMRFGKKFHVINSGISGNNTREALARFDRDVASFKPDIVIVTLGGNDCNPNPPKHVPPEAFAANLKEIVKKIRDLGAIPILQTYYKVLTNDMPADRARDFLLNMDKIREVAAKENVFLIDQYRFFEQLDPAFHRYELMLNSMHVNEQGNILIGIRVLYSFGGDILPIAHHERLLAGKELFDAVLKRQNELNS